MRATVQQLEKVSIFSGLEIEALSRLSSISLVSSYKKNETIIHEGDRFSAALHAILVGGLLVKKVASSGKETNLRKLFSGEIFAAPALFGDGIAPGTIVALKDSEIVKIEKAGLLEAIQTTPEIALQILWCFNQRLQEMHQTIHGLISEKAVVRIARLIHYTADRYGVRETLTGACLNTKLPHQYIARMVGISYEECVRIMRKDLDTVVSYSRGGAITIGDAKALESLASGYEEVPS